jgi:hypothetical protein
MYSKVAGMAEVRYLVVKRNGEWKITVGSVQMGPYRDRIDAIDAAIELADHDGRDGRDSQVLVRGEDKQLRIEWTYGRDPYPEYPESLPPTKNPVAAKNLVAAKSLAPKSLARKILAPIKNAAPLKAFDVSRA